MFSDLNTCTTVAYHSLGRFPGAGNSNPLQTTGFIQSVMFSYSSVPLKMSIPTLNFLSTFAYLFDKKHSCPSRCNSCPFLCKTIPNSQAVVEYPLPYPH